MAKLPYGGHELEPVTNAIWLNLFAIADSLEKGEAPRPNLALWLVEAIRKADKSEKKLLSNLGFNERRGGQEKIPKGWLIYGQKVVDLEGDGMSPEEALSTVLQEIQDEVTRSTLQRWRDAYKKALSEYFTAHE